MISSKVIKNNISQIVALTEKNIELTLRFKFSLIILYLTPLAIILMPLFVLNNFLELKPRIGSWTIDTYIIFQFIAYNIFLLSGIIQKYPRNIYMEKFWNTFTALIIAPLNRFNILLGVFFSHLILMCIPFTIFFILCYILYPISILTLVFIIVIYLLITLIFCGIGLILAIFAVSNENIWKILDFFIVIIFWLSCITYPFEFFPEFLQKVINLNPIYYIIDILRLVWIENNIIISISSHIFHFIILIVSVIIFPSIGVYLFKIIYKKYGIVGY